MATQITFHCLLADAMNGKHNLGADTLKIALTNTAPDQAANTVFADLTEISAGNGYTAGGVTMDITSSDHTAGAYSLVPTGDKEVAASGGSIAPFQYAVLYNDTSATKPLIAYWDYGSELTLADAEKLVLDVGATLLTGSF